ncbi:hypothetical protein D3C84_1010510 [compost metagenome]
MSMVSSRTRRSRLSKRFSAERLEAISRKLEMVSFIRAMETASWSTSSTGERPMAGRLKLKLRMASAWITSACSGLTTMRESRMPSGMHKSRMASVSIALCQRIR